MANIVQVRKLIEGPRCSYFSIYLQNDGVDGELTNRVIVDPTIDFSPPLLARSQISLMCIWYELSGFDVTFSFGGLVNTPIWVTPGTSGGNYTCFEEFGGIKDPSNPPDASGKLQISTTGFVDATCKGSLIIGVKKN